MGNDQSTPEGGEYYGFRVLGIQEESPSCEAGFVSFFDFIVSANGIRLVRTYATSLSSTSPLIFCKKDQRDSTFLELISNSENKPMQLTVFNVKSQTTRGV